MTGGGPGRRVEAVRGSARRSIRAMKVSVVVPVYNEEANLPELLRAAARGAGRPGPALRAHLRRRRQPRPVARDPEGLAARAAAGRASACSSSRATSASTRRSSPASSDVTGDVVVTLDADLQNPPEEIPKLLAKIDEGYDVVGGVRAEPPGLAAPAARLARSSTASRSPITRHAADGLRLHAARLLAGRRRRDQPLRRGLDLHPGAGPELRAPARGGRGRARRRGSRATRRTRSTG